MLLCLPVHAAVFTYDFESLGFGALNGQDNWSFLAGDSAFIVTSGSGANTTKVVGTGGSTSSNFAGRINDGNFSFGSLVGVTSLTLGFDTRYVSGGSDQALFYLNSASGSTQSAYFGLNGDAFYVNANGIALPSGVDPNDWLSLRLVMDLTANSGDGSGSLFYKNLTDGETSYAAVTGMQDMSLGLSIQDPTQWNRLMLRTGFYEGNKIDNLFIETSSAVPEPSRSLLAALGLCGLILRRRRSA